MDTLGGSRDRRAEVLSVVVRVALVRDRGRPEKLALQRPDRSPDDTVAERLRLAAQDAHKIVQGFEKLSVVPALVAAPRPRCREHPQYNRPILFHNITWRALPEKFGHWNSVWKRFWRLSRSGELSKRSSMPWRR